MPSSYRLHRRMHTPRTARTAMGNRAKNSFRRYLSGSWHDRAWTRRVAGRGRRDVSQEERSTAAKKKPRGQRRSERRKGGTRRRGGVGVRTEGIHDGAARLGARRQRGAQGAVGAQARGVGRRPGAGAAGRIGQQLGEAGQLGGRRPALAKKEGAHPDKGVPPGRGGRRYSRRREDNRRPAPRRRRRRRRPSRGRRARGPRGPRRGEGAS